ncbi:MAG TPA: hypothetical protein ENH27_05855 [Rhizobiales bacterium]|nr:hypothetical protein [Hyphomicrobiales bacterium]
MNDFPNKKSVLILGNYRTTLTVAGTLGEEGFRVIVSASGDGAAGARYSRFVDEMWDHPQLDAEGGAAFGEALNAFLDGRPDVTAIFPVAEEFVVWLAGNAAALPARITLVSPAPHLVELCLDKTKMLELASRAGVECAPYAIAGALDELYERAEKIGYPVIVRPFSHLNRLGHKKAVICAGREELAAFFPLWPAGQPGLLLQRYVTGVRHDLYFIAADGEIHSLLETRITRTDHPDGTGLSTEGVHVPVSEAFERDTRRLVRELGYTGIGFIQFVRNPRSGEVTFLELNPRTAGSHRCAEAAGMPLTRAALELARGNTDLGLDPAYRYPTGVTYAWVTGDLYGLKEAMSRGEIGFAGAMRWAFQALRSVVKARIHLTFSWRDPLPAVALLIRQTARGLASAFGPSQGTPDAPPAAGAGQVLPRSGLRESGSRMGSR